MRDGGVLPGGVVRHDLVGLGRTDDGGLPSAEPARERARLGLRRAGGREEDRLDGQRRAHGRPAVVDGGQRLDVEVHRRRDVGREPGTVDRRRRSPAREELLDERAIGLGGDHVVPGELAHVGDRHLRRVPDEAVAPVGVQEPSAEPVEDRRVVVRVLRLVDERVGPCRKRRAKRGNLLDGRRRVIGERVVHVERHALAWRAAPRSERRRASPRSPPSCRRCRGPRRETRPPPRRRPPAAGRCRAARAHRRTNPARARAAPPP